VREFMDNNNRNFIVFLYNTVREEATSLHNKSNNIKLTEHENGYKECLNDISRCIMEYMHDNKDRFYNTSKDNTK
jgi:hypothetical protein